MTNQRTDDPIADPWGPRTPHAIDTPWPTRVDISLDPGLTAADVERWVTSACVLCSNGCGLEIAVKDGRIVGVRGRAEDRINHGRLGPKGLYGWQANRAADRLTRPLVRDGDTLRPASWDEAMGRIVTRSRELHEKHDGHAFGFYNTGQMFLEEYYTLSIIAHAGIGTNHVDGNTRLCTATAAAALRETFAMDGQPGTHADIDHCDTLFLAGMNTAETHTVMWMRMLDRLRGPDRPRLVVVDPRRTPTAREADVHLDVRPGTNLALMNGLLRELIVNDWIDRDFISVHTVGFDEMRAVAMRYPLERVAQVCDVGVEKVRAAAKILGEAKRLFAMCLQGVYQSHQATASAVAVNNLVLVRGMIGRPGCGVMQMNGQPTAQNARECGTDGEIAGFRNWQNDAHIGELARHWNVDPMRIPHWGPPTHAMQMFRFAEQGAILMLWIIATNPAVSLPELHRIRAILSQKRLFVVVQDAFLTETARLADVVLPAALWAEKTGTYTNADRTVHISDKAIEPPGEARADLDIFLEYARRMDFRDKDGAPLVKWHDPESAFEHWKACTAGRPVDYRGISYAKLRARNGIQWPCNDAAPEGTERLYTDHRFFSEPSYCQEYGHDLLTGAMHSEQEYRALNPAGRAILKGQDYVPPHETPDEKHPFVLTTGRVVYHFHTRTKTGRTRELQAAAPEPWVELAASDAQKLGIHEGDRVRVESARGAFEAPARIADIKPGVVFLPFHYGYWDKDAAAPGDGRPPTAANEITLTDWDPVSKQPVYKTAAVRVTRLERK